ncbi:MAG: outer membrane beta-barrel protein [Bacteroidetes bacterium]|nr:outer membrane beta-barrel protein [Bacteroidota bacterium]
MKTQRNITLLFGAIATFCCAIQAQAQDKKSARSVVIGFKASPNFAWTRIMEGSLKNDGMGLGFSYGLMGDFNIAGNPNYWLSCEAIVTSFPSKVAATDTLRKGAAAYTGVDFSYKMQYIQIPVTLKLKTNEIGNLKYWGQFGVGPSFMIQNRLTTNANPSLYKPGKAQSHSPNSSGNDGFDFEGDGANGGEFQDNVVPLRLPLVLGAGIEYNISGKTALVAGLRFDNAFTDLFWDKNVKGRNNYLGIQLGLFF